MTANKFFGLVLLVSLLIWGGHMLSILNENKAAPARIKTQGTQNRSKLELEHNKDIKQLEQKYAHLKLIASGNTVFDRIFNTQPQNIKTLIKNITLEATPSTWSSDVKVEEFTNFVVLIYLPYSTDSISYPSLFSSLKQIADYCSDYLSSIAIFDKHHKSLLFFDKDLLKEIQLGNAFTSRMLADARIKGKTFRRFNSITVPLETFESHMFLPLEVAGSRGVETCYAMLDTGASVTMLSKTLISKTGYDNLSNGTTKSFSTANGMVTCPTTERQIKIAGITKNLEIAVALYEEINLLGMDFFEGMEYLVDSENSCIHIWEK